MNDELKDVKRVGRPTKSILDPSFRYTSSANTRIEDTFARIRWERERAGIKEKRVRVPTVVVDVVVPIKGVRR